jgi:hypothetical protein
MFKLYNVEDLSSQFTEKSDQGYFYCFIKTSDDAKKSIEAKNIIYVTDDQSLLVSLSNKGMGVITKEAFDLMNKNESRKLELLKKVGKNVDQLGSSVAQNISRYKKLYERLSPLRKEQFRNTFINFKYAAGISSGGEFFDYHDLGENRVILFHSCSNSYVFSSIALENFDKWKSRLGEKEQIQRFIDLQLEEAKKINSEAVISLFYIDTRAQNITFYSNKKQELYKNRDAIALELAGENEGQQLHLKLHERLVFLSSGVYKNVPEIQGALPALLQKKTIDLMPEIFFQLKKNDIDDFLNSDASVIVFEIGAEGKV